MTQEEILEKLLEIRGATSRSQNGRSAHAHSLPMEPKVLVRDQGWQPGMDVPVQSFQTSPEPPMNVDPNEGIARPNPQFQPETDRLAEIRAAQARYNAPKEKPGFWMNLLEGAAEGLAYGAQAPQIRLQRGQLDRQRQMDLANEAQQIQQGVQQRQQGQFQIEAANRAEAQEQREMELHPAMVRASQAQATAAERTAMAPEDSVETVDLPPIPALNFPGMKGVPKEVASEIVNKFGELAKPRPEPQAEFEWVLRNGQPVQIKKGTAQAGDAPYSKPEQGPKPDKPDFEWVIRGGQPLQIQKGTAQPGDRPYSEKITSAVASSPYTAERAKRAIDSVDELKKKVSGWTTGFGSLLSSVPTSDALNFAAELDTLKSNIAFNELAQMREASKTGGALGAVSERELKLLESTLGGLDPRQDSKNFIAQLDKVKASIERWERARAQSATTTPTQQPSASGPDAFTLPNGTVVRRQPDGTYR